MARNRSTGSKDLEGKTVAELREMLRKAVEQGKVTARDARRVSSGLVKRGQRQTSEVLKDLEKLLRRGAGVGPSLPIAGYDDLTAAEIRTRLDGLSSAQLRKVRDHERRHANRKTVLRAIDSKLS